MAHSNRRQFLSNVGRGMLIAGVGSAMASELGVEAAFADQGPERLSFGPLDPLVALLQETPVAKLQTLLVERLRSGTVDLKQLVAAGALANARSFGGDDYVGFHTMMALVPALEMSRELPAAEQALPILKVLYRNTDQIQQRGGAKAEAIRPIAVPISVAGDLASSDALRQATRAMHREEAEQTFAALCRGPAIDAYNSLQPIVEDDADVHRVVLAHRAWSLLNVVGEQNAHTMLRQSVRYCVNSEKHQRDKNRPEPAIRAQLPKLLDQYKLIDTTPGNKVPDDAWLDKMSLTLYGATRAQAAETVAAALAEGIAPQAIGEALSLAANLFVLRDKSPRTHGDSAGVHASDSMHAWRGIASVVNRRNAAASLIVAGYHVAESGNKDRQASEPIPLAAHREAIKTRDPQALLKETEEAICANDQTRASAAVFCYGETGAAVRPVFDLLLKYAISEDGRLHSEKYYRTASDEFTRTRPVFRWRQVVSLARVTASSYGYDRADQQGTRAPGYEEARRLLGV